MARGLTPEERRLWDRVARTVSPARGRKAAPPIEPSPMATPAPAKAAAPASRKAAAAPVPSKPSSPQPRTAPAPAELEPRRRRRIARERDPVEAALDLHGFGRFEAEDQAVAFLYRCQAQGMRAVLIVTGQGRRGGGVIRASIHEWLTGPRLRGVVSGFASAHRRHGGDGAFYVTLKRPGQNP